MITTFFGLIGGQVAVLKLIIPRFVRFIRGNRIAQNEQTADDIQQENLPWLCKFQEKVSAFNLFQSIPPSINEFQLQNERTSTRLFIFFFILSLAIIIGYISLKSVTKIENIEVPTFEDYSKLYLNHSSTLVCPCEKISIDYKRFVYIEYAFHEVCNSVYITNEWIAYVDGRATPEIIGFDDFRATGMNAFRALRSLCQLTNKTVSESLIGFYSKQYISATIQPLHLFEFQIQLLLEQFMSSITNDLISSLELVRDTTQVNGLWALAGMQYNIYTNIEFDSLSLVVRDYFDCSCDNSPRCIRQSSIYRFSDKTVLFLIPGLYLGCLAIEALLQSTLECFYNQTCINKLQSYYAYKKFLNVTVLDSTLLGHFPVNSTIEELVNKSMIKEWSRTITFKNYYNTCRPTHCFYSYSTRNHIFYIVTTIFGLCGGLITALKFILPLLVKLARRHKRLPITIPDNITNQPTLTTYQKSIKFLRNLNLFVSIPPSINGTDLRNERISTRLLILLLFLSTATIIMYTSLVKINKIVSINAPTFKTYSNLYITYSQTLTCPCTTISVNYKRFLNVKYTFHQVCSSIFVTEIWRQQLLQTPPQMTSYFRDFRGTRKYLFQALNTFCQLAEKTMSKSLTQFYSNRYISITVVPSDLFYLQLQSSFEHFMSLATNELLLSLEIIRKTTHANAFFSGRWTNYDLHPTFSPRLPYTEILTQNPQYYSNCRCDISRACVEPSVIYDKLGVTKLFTIPGIYKGCFMIESLLQSTLECFYNQTCINELNSYLLSNLSLDVKALDPSLASRFVEKSIMEELVNELMIEKWNLSMIHENYYNAN
ncbi:unnamed protein product [Rotaria socialis]